MSLKINGPSQAALSATYAARGGPGVIGKPLGDGSAGIIDLINDDTTGYLLHLHTGPNSGVNTAAIGIGTDNGSGYGILVSHKNSGAGIGVTSNPGSGFAEYLIGYSLNALSYSDLYVGSGGTQWRLRTGQGYYDGVVTVGSKTITSSTAAFTAADIGQSVQQLTSRGTGDPLGAIPNGATIASVESATSATMSVNAAYSATAMRFKIGGRAPAWNQSILTAYDTDGTTVLGLINKAGIDWRASQVDRPAVKVRSKVGMTGSILEVVDSANTVLSRFGPNGHMMTRKATAPALAEMVDGEAALWVDASGNLKVTARVAGALKVGTVTVA